MQGLPKCDPCLAALAWECVRNAHPQALPSPPAAADPPPPTICVTSSPGDRVAIQMSQLQVTVLPGPLS